MKQETAQEILRRLQCDVENAEAEIRKAGHHKKYDILLGSLGGIQDIIEECICDCDDIDSEES